MAPSGPEYANSISKARQRYEESGHRDYTLYLTECASIATNMYINELSKKHPGHPAIAAAATAAGGMQSTFRYLIQTSRHYFNDPHEETLSHHDVINNIVKAVKATADDELEPLRKMLRNIGFKV